MLKRFIKYCFYRAYTFGKYEYDRLNKLDREERLSKISQIDSTAWISDGAEIHNNSRPKDKIRIGANSRIMGQLFLFDAAGAIQIGRECFVGPNSKIWSAKRIKIGDRVLISHNVNIHDNISHPVDAKIRHVEFVRFYQSGVHDDVDLRSMEVVIEDDVWIGFNSIVLKGVTIGRGAIIGAGSVVTKNVDPWTINVGNPLRCIEKLEPKISF